MERCFDVKSVQQVAPLSIRMENRPDIQIQRVGPILASRFFWSGSRCKSSRVWPTHLEKPAFSRTGNMCTVPVSYPYVVSLKNASRICNFKSSVQFPDGKTHPRYRVIGRGTSCSFVRPCIEKRRRRPWTDSSHSLDHFPRESMTGGSWPSAVANAMR